MRLFAVLGRLIHFFKKFPLLARRIFVWIPPTGTSELQHQDYALVLSVVAPERLHRWRQLRYLLRVCSPLEQRILITSAVIGAIAILLAGARLIHSHLVVVPVVGGTLTEALIGQPKYINPLDAVENDVDRDLTYLLYSGLFRLSELQPIPDLAERYSWSEDYKKLTVRLRTDARFHDGVPVTAADVLFTFESLKDPARRSPLAPLLRGVTVSTSDSATIIFELDKPDASFLTRLTIGILPEHGWEKVSRAGARLSDLNLKPIGSGPYRVKSFSRDTHGAIHSFTLERFEQYAGIKPLIKTIVFQFFVDARQAIEAIKAERVDALAFIKTPWRHQTAALELPQETIAFFNLKHPVLGHKEVRQAFALAVDRTELATTIARKGVLVNGPYPFEAATATKADIEGARKILQENGWIMPSGGSVRVLTSKPTPRPTISSARRRTKRGRQNNNPASSVVFEKPSIATSTELAVTITVPQEPELVAVAEMLKRQWSLLGARVNIDALPIDDLVRRATRERTAQVILFNVLLGSDQDISPFWSSNQTGDHGLNVSNLRDRAVDDAIEATRRATSTESLMTARAAVTHAIQQHIPAIFLLRPLQPYLLSNKVRGVPSRMLLASPSERFRMIERWFIKTGRRWR